MNEEEEEMFKRKRISDTGLAPDIWEASGKCKEKVTDYVIKRNGKQYDIYHKLTILETCGSFERACELKKKYEEDV